MQTMENYLRFDTQDFARKPRSQFLQEGFWRAGCLLLIVLVVLALPARAQKQANLERLVVVGDSLSAGFQNDSTASKYTATQISSLNRRRQPCRCR